MSEEVITGPISIFIPTVDGISLCNTVDTFSFRKDGPPTRQFVIDKKGGQFVFYEHHIAERRLEYIEAIVGKELLAVTPYVDRLECVIRLEDSTVEKRDIRIIDIASITRYAAKVLKEYHGWGWIDELFPLEDGRR